VRQYFPKKTDFSKVTLSQTMLAVDKLNHRPRKRLDFKSPFEVFFDPSVALQS
jgi:IS30 family transposase